MDAFRLLCRTEGIIPAIESAHALAGAIKVGQRLAAEDEAAATEKIVLVNLSGRGDKDVATAARMVRPAGQGSPEARDRQEGSSCEHGQDAGTAARHASKSAAAIDRARAQGRAALIGYLPAGYPSVEDTIAAGIALAENGADLIEIGIPYSDPVMDGQVIQAATTEALAQGLPRPAGLRRRPRHHEQDRRRRAGHDLLEPRGPDGRGRILPPPGRGRGSRAHHARPDPGRGRRMDGSLRQVRPGPGVPGGAVVLAGAHEAHRRGEPRLRLRRLHHGRHRCPRPRSAPRPRTSWPPRTPPAPNASAWASGVSNADQVREIAAYADGVIVGTALVAAIRRRRRRCGSVLDERPQHRPYQGRSLSNAVSPPRGGDDPREHSEPGLVRIRHPAAVGVTAHPRLRPVHPRRHHRRPLAHVRALGRTRGAPEGSVWDIAIWAIPFGIIGGRLYHVFSSPDAYFGPGFDGTGDLSLIPQIQRGGLGIWGAVAAGRRGCLDRLPPGRGQAQRLPGRRRPRTAAGPGDRPLGQLLQPGALRRPHHPAVGPADRRRQRRTSRPAWPADTLFHPTFLYESLWNLAGVLHPAGAGPASSASAAAACSACTPSYYTLGRVWIEAMRIDDAEQISLFGITTRLNVWTSIFVLLGALAAFIILGLRKPASRTRRTSRAANRPRPNGAAEASPDATKSGRTRTRRRQRRRADRAGEEAATVPAVRPRHADAAVSDSESRDNLPDNQSGPGHVFRPAEASRNPPAAPSPPRSTGSRNIRPPGHRNRAGS